MSWPGGLDPNLLRQLSQLQQGLAAQQASGMTPVNTAMPQTQTPQPSSTPAAVDNAVQMMMARAMSVPLATVLFQSMMGSTQQPPAQPVFQQSPPLFNPVNQTVPAAQAPSPLMQPALLQMMQQVAQATAASSAVAPPQQVSAPTPPLQVTVPPAVSPLLPSPVSASTSSSPSPSIQLPPMDPSVAKGLLLQLVQQLQQAGQLPCDDSIQRLLQPNTDSSNMVEVKKEVTQQVPGQSPICVISKTEGFDEKPIPEVYMDNAEDNTSSSGVSASARDNIEHDVDGDGSKDDEDVIHPVRTAKSKQSDSRQKTLSYTISGSAAAYADPKLWKKCIVRLDRVDASKKWVSVQSSQLSRVDKLKNMKKHYVSTDILQTRSTTSPQSQQPAATTAASCNKLADQRAATSPLKEMAPVKLQPAPTKAGTRNIFSIFAQHVTGSGVQQEEPVAEVRPSDPLPQSVGVLLQRSVNSADNSIVSLRSMYLGYASHNMEWLSLISSIFDGSQKTFCQCTFCPKLGELPRDVAVHISNDHQDLLFALNKLKPVVGPMVYIKCRHCNFVTVESTLAWIHFDIHHGISDILDCSDHAGDMDLSGPDMPEKFIDIDEVVGSLTAYVCFDCSAVNAEPDTNASSMLMARHVACQHPDSVNCNGNFVKLMMLARTEGDPDSIKGSPTYRQAITEDQHIRGRREVYICMFCRYSAFSPYLALSHSISAHQTKTMLFICNNGNCDYQCLAEVDMVQHMKVEHSDHGNSIPLVCTATLVVKKSNSSGYVECPVLVKRTGTVEFVTSSREKSKSAAQRTAVTAKRNVRHVSVSSSDEDDDEDDESEDEEVPPKRHNLRHNVKTKKAKSPKAGGRGAGGKQTKQASKTKTTRNKKARIDEDSEEELQNTTVTSTNDRSITTTTAAATAMTEDSNDGQTHNVAIVTVTENAVTENAVTTPKQVEDSTEDEETAENERDEQERDNTGDETGNSDVMTTSEQVRDNADDEETGENDQLDLVTTAEQTEDNTENEVTDTGETEAQSSHSHTTAMATAGESVMTEQVEATDWHKEVDTHTASDQMNAMSTTVITEAETYRGIESADQKQSIDEGTDDLPPSQTSAIAAVDLPSSVAMTTASAAALDETETAKTAE